MTISRVGVDIAKSVFHVHGVDRHDKVQWRGKYARDKWLNAIANRFPTGAEIAIHLDVGLSQRQIVQKLGIHSSTVSRELRRNPGAKGYEPAQAQRYSDQRRRSAWKWTK